MAGFLLADLKQITALGALTSVQASASFQSKHLRVPHPRPRYRTTTVNPAVIHLDTSRAQLAGAVAVLYASATPHRNCAQNGNELDAASWTAAGLTPAKNLTLLPIRLSYSWGLTATGGPSAHEILCADYVMPQSTDRNLQVSVYLREEATAGNLAIEISDGTNTARAFFDKGDGTLDSTTVSGFVLGSTATVPVTPVAGGGNWHRVSLRARASSAATTYKVRVYVTDDAHAISYTAGTESAIVAAVLFEDGEESTTPSAFIENTTDTASWLLVTNTGTGDAFDGTTDEDWRQWVPKGQEELFKDWNLEFGWTHQLRTYTADQLWLPATASLGLQVKIHDPSAAHVELSNVLAGQKIVVARGIQAGWSLSWIEEGAEDKDFRAVNDRHRVMRFGYAWVTEAEAHGDFDRVDRELGRSEPLLLVREDPSTKLLQEMAYGYSEVAQLDHLTWSKDLNSHAFRRAGAVREIPLT